MATPKQDIERSCKTCMHQTLLLDDAPSHCWDCRNSKSKPHWEAFTTDGIPIYADESVTKPAQTVMEKQVGGSHYKDKGVLMQPWAIILAWGLGFWRANVLKYLLRAPQKNGKQDIEKAIHYLEYVRENYDELKAAGLL